MGLRALAAHAAVRSSASRRRSTARRSPRETQALLTLARWSGSNGFFAGRSVDEARAAVRATRRGSTARRPPIPMAEVRGDRGPRGRRADPGAHLLAPATGPEARRRCSSTTTGAVGCRRPRQVRRGLPAPCRRLRLRVLAVDYRLAPSIPSPPPLEDAFAAAEWTDANAESSARPRPARRRRRLRRRQHGRRRQPDGPRPRRACRRSNC